MGKVSGEGRVDCSAGTGSGFYARGGQEKKKGRGEKSEAHVVYPRECHVGGADY